VKRGPAAAALAVLLLVALAGRTAVRAQQQGGGAASAARDRAPIDLTGYWVSYVTENWRYRMVTPAKGEYRRIPSSRAALPLINAWDPAADERAGNQCKSYGAGSIMSVPGRLHITWQDADTLRLETDAGTQTWEPAAGGGSLRVVTSNLRAGYLRKNGVPYGERATVTEHFDVAPLADRGTGAPGVADAGRLLLITTIVEDPEYLTGPYIVSPHFKKEPDGSKWDPTPCSSTW
jgi:hypothetical protein